MYIHSSISTILIVPVSIAIDCPQKANTLFTFWKLPRPIWPVLSKLRPGVGSDNCSEDF